jgi:hypothetical protein
MRVLVLAAFALAACNDDNDRLASLESNTGDLTAIRAELAALRAEVGAMPVMPDVKPLADRLTALEAQVAKLSEARKVPHLVSRDTGVDYGVSVDGALAAWNEELGAVVDYSPPQDTFFSKPDCQGDPLLNPNTGIYYRFPRLLFDPAGRLMRATSTARVNATNGSRLGTDKQCTNFENVNGFPGVYAKSSTPFVVADDLSIEPR